MKKFSVKYVPTVELLSVNTSAIKGWGLADDEVQNIVDQVYSLNEPVFLYGGKTAAELSRANVDRDFFLRALMPLVGVIGQIFMFILVASSITVPAEYYVAIASWWALTIAAWVSSNKLSEPAKFIRGIRCNIHEMRRAAGRDGISDFWRDGIVDIWKDLRGTQISLQKEADSEFNRDPRFIENLNKTSAIKSDVIKLAEMETEAKRKHLRLSEMGEEIVAFEAQVKDALGEIRSEMVELRKEESSSKLKSIMDKPREALTTGPKLNSWSFDGTAAPTQEIVHAEVLK